MEIRVTPKRIRPTKRTTIAADLVAGPFPPHERSILINGATLTNVTVDRQSFDSFIAIGATFNGCRFTKSKFSSGSFGALDEAAPQSRYIDCTFQSVRIASRMWPDNARFERCAFLDVRIRGWRANHAEFIDCTFTGELRDCWFMGTTERAMHPKRERNEFRGNDFSGAELIASQFDYGIDVRAQRWPTDPRYIILDRLHARVAGARVVISRWPDDEEREYGLAMLRILSDDGMAHQDESILRRDEWFDWRPQLRDEFFRLLEADPGPA